MLPSRIGNSRNFFSHQFLFNIILEFLGKKAIQRNNEHTDWKKRKQKAVEIKSEEWFRKRNEV